FAYASSSVFIIAADDHVAIHWTVLLQQIRRQIVKRRNNHNAFGHKFSSLLRGRALPHTQSTRRLPADTRRQRHGRIYNNLSRMQGRLDVLQHLSLSFERNGKDDDLCLSAREFIFSAR